MRLRIELAARQIVIAVPRQIPPAEARAELHRLVDTALDSFAADNFDAFPNGEAEAADVPLPAVV
jgi:hypothetical protein